MRSACVQDIGERRTAVYLDGRIDSQVCAFALARDEDEGTERRYALPSRPDRSEAGAPARLAETLRALARRCPGGLQARYTTLSFERAIAADGVAPARKRAAVWALAGQALTPGGGAVPIGWSGAGDGLDAVDDDRHAGRLAWLLGALDGASAGEAYSGPALLSPQAAAVLLHEAIGHYVEGSADPRVSLAHRLGRRIADERLDLLDDPAALGAPARYACDDEGVETLGPVQVVRQGVVLAQLHSRASAALAGALSTGNGRAGVWSAALPRMSNLVCAAGEDGEDALLDQLWDGLMIHHLAHGYGRGGEIQARVVLAENVERGRRTGRFLCGLRVSETIDLFLRAQAVGDRALANPNAMCGKAGQVLFDVGTVAPAILLGRLELRP